MNKPVVHVIESNEWDAEHIRSFLRKLDRSVRIASASEVESGKARADVIIFGFSDAVSFETSQAQLKTARAFSPRAQLILCASREVADIDSKVLHLKARAFLLKPLDEDMFHELLDETLAQIQLRHERAEYAKSSRKSANINKVIGDSDEIHEVLALLERVAQSASTSVLLLGESGVGKSLFAQTVHELCEAAQGPFIEINCATLPSQLLESELFGYEAGAFTDARGQKIGLIELADGGTLFLDEITEIEPVTQAKLLKFFDTKRFRRVGGQMEVSVDTRIVAASNRDIRAEVQAGNFREDLYYRLNVVEISIPPLRERTSDIGMIIDYYLDYYRKKFNKPHTVFSEEAIALLHSYPWPGNVRELVNVIERAVLLSPDDVIERNHLPIDVSPQSPAAQRLALSRDDGRLVLDLPPGGITLDDIERAAVEAALRRTRGNISRAANLLGVSRGAFRNKLVRYKIEARAFARVVEPV